MVEENKNQENTTEENSVSVGPKQKIVGSQVVSPNGETTEEVFKEAVSPSGETAGVPVVENLEVEKPIEEQVEVSKSEIVDEVVSPTGETTKNENAGLPRSSVEATEFAQTTEEVEPEKPISDVAEAVEDKQNQEIPAKVEIKTVEKIVYKTDPNLIQKLLIKARAKIQERKRKKLDKIMSLFESNSEISNSDIQNLLRTTKRSATRYLNILEKEGRITQVGTTGRRKCKICKKNLN